MVDDARKTQIIEDARLYLGIPRPNADALVALNIAWDMGYRSPANLAHVAGKILRADLVSGVKAP